MEMHVCLCVYVLLHVDTEDARVSIGFLGAGVIAGCELPDMGDGNQTHCPL